MFHLFDSDKELGEEDCFRFMFCGRKESGEEERFTYLMAVENL